MTKNPDWITAATNRIWPLVLCKDHSKVLNIICEEYDRAHPPRHEPRLLWYELWEAAGKPMNLSVWQARTREVWEKHFPPSQPLPRGDLTAGGNSPLIMFSGAVDKKEVGPIKYELMDKVWGRTFKEWLQIEEYARKHGYKPGGESAFGCNQTGAKSASAPADSPAPVSADVVDEKKFVALLDECCECCEGDGRYECGASPETNRAYKEVVLAFRNLAAERDQYQKESIRRWEKDYFPEMRKRQQAEARLERAGKLLAAILGERHCACTLCAYHASGIRAVLLAIECGPEEAQNDAE